MRECAVWMDTKGRLVSGSHNRNEFVVINADEIGRVSAVKISSFLPFLCHLAATDNFFFLTILNFFWVFLITFLAFGMPSYLFSVSGLKLRF